MQSKLNTDPNLIFTPIHSEIANNIRKDTLCLHSTFWVNGNKAQEMHLILSSQYLVIAEKIQNDFNYLGGAPLEFDLKF